MNRHATAKKIGIFALIFAIILGISAAVFWHLYYAEFNEIKTTLMEMPDVELIRAWGNPDTTFEDMGAQIRVKDKGDIQFVALSRESFISNSVICLYSIGPYRFECGGSDYDRVDRDGKPVPIIFQGNSIDIEPDGDFAQLFPFQIKTVQDVIGRYDDICGIISNWPVAPERKYFKNKDGIDIYYSTIMEIQQSVPGYPPQSVGSPEP